MVMTVEGLNRLRDLVEIDIDKGQLGTGGTAASENDTDLETPDATTLLDLDSISKSTKSLQFNYILPSTGGTTGTYKEFKLQSSSSSTDYDRIVFTGVQFTSGGTEDINISKIYRFRGL